MILLLKCAIPPSAGATCVLLVVVGSVRNDKLGRTNAGKMHAPPCHFERSQDGLDIVGC